MLARIWKQIVVAVGVVLAALIAGANLASSLFGLAQVAANPTAKLTEVQQVFIWLTSTPWWVPTAIMVGLAAWLIYITRPVIAPAGEIGDQTPDPPRKGAADDWKLKPPAALYQLTMPELFNLAQDSRDVRGIAKMQKPIKIAERLYDSLKNGHMRSWGQQSNFYPPTVGHPRPPISAIPASFWNNNTIEELEAGCGRHNIQKSGEWECVSLPDPSRFDRAKAECYWNIIFERDEARKAFPPRQPYY